MNASQAAILERAAAAAVNGHRARPRAATAAALRSCRRPAGLLLARRGLLLPRGLLLRLRLRAASAAASSGPLLLLGAAAASRPRSGEGARRGRAVLFCGAGRCCEACAGLPRQPPHCLSRSLPLILRLLFQTRVGEAGGRAGGRAGGGRRVCLRAGRRGRGRQAEEGEGRAEKKCMAEGRVETDTGSKMARRPPAPSPPAGCVCVCVCHSVYPPNDWAGKVPTAGVELTQQHNADTGALRTRAPPSGPAIPPLGLEPGLGLVTCPARRAVANAVAVGV